MRIPYPFVNRMGELSKSTLSMDTADNINRAGHIFKEAENFAWLMAEKSLESVYLAMTERGPKGVRFRILFSEFPQSYPNAPTIEKRTLPSIPCIILCTEKEAGVCLASMDGRIDYAGFYSKDPMFINWARDLFLHYWDLGKPS
jgi:predicted transcriptional regulator